LQIRGHDIGVCSWSLQPGDTDDLIARVRQLGLEHLQLALAPLVEADDESRARDVRRLRQSGLRLTAGMINFPGEDYSTIAMIRQTGGFVPDATWEERKEMTLAAADVARDLGITMISTHVGFIPPSSDAGYKKMVARACEVAEPLMGRGIELLMETGQESASELLQFLNDLRCRGVFVNFDPANMILYGAGDPIEAIGILGRHIRHVHVKDAMMSAQPRMKWGEEVPFGSGQVSAEAFLEALDAVGYRGPLMVEREAGSERLRDVQTAIATLRSLEGKQ
jgi:sugar phosphate isomerase/epimerase